MLRGHQGRVHSAVFSSDGSHIVTASDDNTARIWDVHLATLSPKDLIAEVCLRRLHYLTSLSGEEMRLAAFAEDSGAIDVCEGVE